MKQITFIILCLLLFVGCTNSGSIYKPLTMAEALLENAPDSTLLILDNINSLDELSNDFSWGSASNFSWTMQNTVQDMSASEDLW